MKKTEIEDALRYEKKYIVSAGQIELLKCHLEELCPWDDYSDSGGGYTIRSLYFDDYEGNSYRENEIGTEPRSKFRLRIYNYDPDAIFLEQKTKVMGKIYKDRVEVGREFCEALLYDEWQAIDYPVEDSLVNRFLTACHTRLLRPRIIVEYDREPYVYPEGDIRITFDRNISFSEDLEHFFHRDILLQPVMEAGKDLLEIKYREFLPGVLAQGLSVRQLQQYTFSKYYLCEMYRRMGGNTV